MKPILFYTVGYPGAGKTTLARNLAGWFGGPHLRADEIGLKLFVMPTFSEAERVAVYQSMDHEAMAGLNNGLTILYDGTLNTARQRQHLHNLAEKRGAAAIGLWVRVPYEVAKDRAGRVRDTGVGNAHGRVVPPELFDRYAAAFEEPDAKEPVIAIDGRQRFGQQYRALHTRLATRHIALPRFLEL